MEQYTGIDVVFGTIDRRQDYRAALGCLGAGLNVMNPFHHLSGELPPSPLARSRAH